MTNACVDALRLGKISFTTNSTNGQMITSHRHPVFISRPGRTITSQLQGNLSSESNNPIGRR